MECVQSWTCLGRMLPGSEIVRKMRFEETAAQLRAQTVHERKGKPMNWDQIEVKWAAMARRVRSDLPWESPTGPDEDLPTPQPGDLPGPPPPEAEKANLG